MRSTISNLRKATLLVCLSTVLTFAVSSQTPAPTSTPITNEYRATFVTSKPVSDKVILFQYLGYVSSPDKNVKTMYYSPPGVIYKPHPQVELWGGLFGLYNWNKNADDSWELRPLAGVKVYVPNKIKWNIYNFTRVEGRFINQSNNLRFIPRARTRFGIEAPLAKQEKAWTPKTFYALADVEPIWRLDEKRLQLVRARAGLGYVFSKKFRAEFIYHAELSGTSTQPFDHNHNIWRLNFKLMLPRKGVHHTHDIDIE